MAANEIDPDDIPAQYGPYEATAYSIGYRDACLAKTAQAFNLATFQRAYTAGRNEHQRRLRIAGIIN